ncbi:MAG: bifunctional tRNA (5-methylaminomethyl-2-thiouridine)(34)-methyltransferase MnmD/FAD-dependent 5-carboxymethylaminomethyl-2-thiouridine(34) oxidoreductase MnmC [Hyphomonadaceae bacterium]|nr:bifunctional tRNA (5-methylaminomethyl-2-thiouridine)(34)-methyltransferase MnmD/FAD-dependent 5-carboxymethylaminomethyl-2-thiouridine(34) oxidoreductase MnmC [Hyphomonadaceae bacterium]
MSRLPPRPDLAWTPDGAPRSVTCDDVYFSRDGGLEETRAVFLAGCGLPERWAGRARFAIGELGFGAGLNALATWEMWRRTRAPGAVLHYVSIEGFPLERDEAARAHAAFPEIAALSARLLDQWPVRARGAQRLWFVEDGFTLTVIHADAQVALDGMTGAFDAWFLDGFAPARNEAMWSASLMQRIAALSAPDARAATYSVAGAVRRALADAGFAVEKAQGFARKRERLEARLLETSARIHPLLPYSAPEAIGRVAIIGAGVAGASVAAALVKRGVEVVVFEAAAAPGAGASGNAAGLMMPRLDRADTGVSRLHLAAYLEALRTYAARGVLDAVGVVEMPDGDDDAMALADLLADPPLPETHFQNDAAGALHPRAGVVRPRAVLDALLNGVDVRCSVCIASLSRSPDGWTLHDAEGRAVCEASAVVIANGAALARFSQTRWLPLEYSRGQVEHGPLDGAPPAHALSGDGYVAPFGDSIVFGATFDRTVDPVAEADASSRARNLAQLARLAPDIAARVRLDALQSRAGIRTATPDRAPLAGLAPDAAAFNARHAGLMQGRPAQRDAPSPAHEGLYILGGLGARGFALGPLLGERIASEICAEPQALDQGALDAINPARFLIRALKRGRPVSG